LAAVVLGTLAQKLSFQFLDQTTISGNIINKKEKKSGRPTLELLDSS